MDECCPVKKVWGSIDPDMDGWYVNVGKKNPQSLPWRCNNGCIYVKKTNMMGMKYCFADSMTSQSYCDAMDDGEEPVDMGSGNGYGSGYPSGGGDGSGSGYPSGGEDPVDMGSGASGEGSEDPVDMGSGGSGEGSEDPVDMGSGGSGMGSEDPVDMGSGGSGEGSEDP